jgi:hypothetical protein
MPSVKHEMLHRLLDEAVLMDSLSLGLEEEFVSHHSRKLTLKETSCGVWRATRKQRTGETLDMTQPYITMEVRRTEFQVYKGL